LGLQRLFDSLATSSPNLHTLELIVEDDEPIDVTAENGLFTHRFPHLRALTLEQSSIENVEVASEFWSSHPQLERIELYEVSGHWFDDLPAGTLPKLNTLKVRKLFPL
jgi:hypothetical protein